jgi:catechol 2,3-dioxygenase-like lactoylglutathione lyase family enzyme
MGIQLRRVGHVGILVSNFERSFKFYTETLGCKVTRRYTRPDGTETGFLRFEQDHHNFVIGTAPEGADVDGGNPRHRLVQQIAFQVNNREEWLDALSHVRSHGVEIIQGPFIHGPESGGSVEESGSRSFYFLDPDGNRLEIYTEPMPVHDDEEFPRQQYVDAFAKN